MHLFQLNCSMTELHVKRISDVQTQGYRFRERWSPQTSSLVGDLDIFRQRIVRARVHRSRKGGEVRGAAEKVTYCEKNSHKTVELRRRAAPETRPAQEIG